MHRVAQGLASRLDGQKIYLGHAVGAMYRPGTCLLCPGHVGSFLVHFFKDTRESSEVLVLLVTALKV